MIPVREFLPGAVADIVRKAPLTDEKVMFAWRVAVGAAVAKVTTVALRENVLYVRVSDALWQREIERSAGVVRTRLDALLGTGVVRYIDVSVERQSSPRQAPASNRSADGSETGRRRR